VLDGVALKALEQQSDCQILIILENTYVAYGILFEELYLPLRQDALTRTDIYGLESPRKVETRTSDHPYSNEQVIREFGAQATKEKRNANHAM
jgi:hypothetical protein